MIIIIVGVKMPIYIYIYKVRDIIFKTLIA